MTFIRFKTQEKFSNMLMIKRNLQFLGDQLQIVLSLMGLK